MDVVEAAVAQRVDDRSTQAPLKIAVTIALEDTACEISVICDNVLPCDKLSVVESHEVRFARSGIYIIHCSDMLFISLFSLILHDIVNCSIHAVSCHLDMLQVGLMTWKSANLVQAHAVKPNCKSMLKAINNHQLSSTI